MNPYTGSDFDDFLAEEGVLEAVLARALKRTLVLQLEEIMVETQMTKEKQPDKNPSSTLQDDFLEV